MVNTIVDGLCNDAVIFNQKVINNYGPKKFRVVHSGDLTSEWAAENRKHLDRLLKIELNLGYIIVINRNISI